MAELSTKRTISRNTNAAIVRFFVSDGLELAVVAISYQQIGEVYQ